MNFELEQLIRTLAEAGHNEIVSALRKGRIEKLSDRQKMLLADASTCIRMARTRPDERRVKNALVEVTSSGWSREAETTEPGLIQPLMNL
ncbi:hypothetical protein [Marinobacterium iners]|uniref:Uncharacterized protein n=1 Tax=Marinobacterium iners DSM 11526 TaxID=1122198 RepID=A0A1H3ZFY0_9GAMM|nr:hypothetical protein [Marinobacterium iners]SEA22693.1 hypothetical protein SAMN02745729_10229 [Marinobacterium iners DSM 11526]